MKIKAGITSSLLLLTFIFLFGFFLRIINLSSYPNALARDEAYLGYNAYSLSQTGRDINGHILPLFIESFLYTPAGYAYVSIPFIRFFGLNIFSIRLASSIFGAFTIPILFLLTRSLLKLSRDKRYSEQMITNTSLLSAFLLAITPWHINLSRTASVSTVVTFFITLGFYFFAEWLTKSKSWMIVLSFLSFFLSLFFYIAPYTFLPPLVLLSFLLFRKSVSKISKKLFFSLFVLLLVPVAFTIFSPTLSLRIQSLSLTKSALVPLVLIEDTRRDGVTFIPPVIARAFHNKVTVVADLFLQNYFNHFSYNFLFRDNGFPERYKIPEVGLLYPIFLLFILMGCYYLLRMESNIKWLLLGWIVLAPVGSGFASDDVPNLQRTLFMLPPLLIIASLGLVNFYHAMKKNRMVCYLISFVIIVILSYEAAFYLHQYFVHENSYRPWYRQEGYEELAGKINRYQSQFGKVVVTNRESAPTIFLLFFNKYNPSLIQKTIEKSSLRDTDRISFANYEITQEECPLRVVIDQSTGKMTFYGQKDILYVNSGLCRNENLPATVKIVDTVLRSDGSKVFYLMKVE